MASHRQPVLLRLPTWLAAVIAVGLVAAIGVAAAAGNPVATSPFVPGTPTPEVTTTEALGPTGVPRGLNQEGGWLGYVLGAVILLALVAFALAIIVLTIRMFSGRHNGLLRRRVLEPEEIELLTTPLPDVDLLGLNTPVADAVQAGLVDVVSGHDVRSAIIGAWLRLEDVGAQVGTPRRDTDAPGDLVQRLLSDHDVGSRRLEELAELYRRARFSHGPLGERDRDAAVRALSAVRSDLLCEPIPTMELGSTTERLPTRWN